MKVLFRYIFFLFLIYALSSCESEVYKQHEISGKVVNDTGCKNLKSEVATATPDTLSCVKYSYHSSSGKLKLIHINTGFNCCPESLYCTVFLYSDTIEIREYEKSALCDCNCLYDLDIELSGVLNKKYVLKFIEPYAASHEKIIFNVDLSTYPDGSYCVVRKGYPWGMSN